MTLIIAGHEQAKNEWNDVWATPETSLATDGLFAVSDSVITMLGSNGLTPILTGHKKIHDIQIKLWKPYFIGEYFKDYYSTYLETTCLLAFSGSTLTASHAINLVQEHLSKLRISYELSSGKYITQRHCQYNVLEDSKSPYVWSEDTFLDSDFAGILTAEYLSEVIEHSLNIAMKSARKFRLDENAINAMRADFIVGVTCPAKNTHHLYTYRMRKKITDGVFEIYMEKTEIPPTRVAVIGLTEQFEAGAQAALDRALSTGNSTGAALFNFLNDSIESISNAGSFAIAYPSVHKNYKDGKLEKIKFRNE